MNRKVKQPRIKTRDYLMVDIINGVTKGGAHMDIRKQGDKYRCRGPPNTYWGDEEE
jgi:hypothetical protein